MLDKHLPGGFNTHEMTWSQVYLGL